MNLKRLFTFIQVAEHRRFTDVAALQNLTQSGISRQIKKLEEELGVQLFERKTAFVDLTPAGRLMYTRAKELLVKWEELVQESHSLHDGLSGIFKLGASTIPATCLLPQMIKSFQSRYPQVRFSVKAGDSSRILRQVEAQELDAAIIGRDPKNSNLAARPIINDHLVLIGGDPNQRIHSLEDIVHRPFIFREAGSGTREAVSQSLRKAGIDPGSLNITIEVSTTESMLAMVEAGLGLAFVSEWAVRQTVRKNITVLHHLPTDRCFYFIVQKSRQDQPLMKLFMSEANLTVQPFSSPRK